MKDSDSSNNKLTLEVEEQNENAKREKSRGKRRTAREIAQMFEQLKQRHSARKQEWQMEKQELLKQASLAEESKSLLVELKGILEDMKSQLSVEEMRRKNVEAEFSEARNEWKIEKERLLKIIANLESKHFAGLSYDKKVTQELEKIKSRLLSNEKELAAVQKSNLDKQRSMMELRHSFEKEKKKLTESHEGEKRNWEKARQVMLEKIEALKEELNSARTDSFPLHGRHVASPTDDIIIGLTSPESDEMFAKDIKEQKEVSRKEMSNIRSYTLHCYSEPRKESETETPALKKNPEDYGDFQRTVDDALDQIDKITQDLEKMGSANHLHPNRVETSLQPTTDTSPGTSTGSNQRLSYNTSRYRIQTLPQIATSIKDSSFLSEQKKSNLTHSPCLEPKETFEKLSANENKNQSNFVSRPSRLDNISKDASCSRKSSLLESTDNSLSPSSCSIPTFTESSAESPQGQAFLSPKKESHTSSSKSTNGSQASDVFTKIGKDCSVKSPKKIESKPKKTLPSLHQQLLFGAVPKLSKSPNRLTGREESKNSKQSLKATPKTSLKRQSTLPTSETTDFLENPQSKTYQTTSYKQQPHSKRNQDQSNGLMKPPPVRPKPSITVEKDTRGNILRVISDPSYRLQESPRSNSFENYAENTEIKNRRRRSEGVIHDLEPLISDKSLPNTNLQNQNPEVIVNKQSNQNSSKEIKEEKESLGSKGKTWIKKRLSFLETTPKVDSIKPAKSPKSPKRRIRATSNLKPSRRCEEQNISVNISSSEESDRLNNLEKSRLQSKKGKVKRYTRSKTDGSTIDIRNLLSKFKTTKKPSIVKEFEKRLLENEVKTLDEDLEFKKATQNKQRESARKTEIVRGLFDVVDDDGYSGEDELEYSSRLSNRFSKNQSYGPPVRSSSIRSLHEKMTPLSENLNKISLHRSLIDLSSFDVVDSDVETDQNRSPFSNESDYFERGSPQRAMQHVKTSFSTSSQSTHSVQDSLNPITLKQFNRTSANRLSLPARNQFAMKAKKRLSWASSLQESVDENAENQSPEDPQRERDDKVESISTSFGGILLKPKPKLNATQGILTTSSAKENTNQSTDSDKAKHQITKKLQKRAESLEKVLKKGPTVPRSRRYKRSETQPIKWSPTSEDSNSTSEEQICAKENLPNLTLRFKKPAPANRRLPSRWKKNTK